MKNKNVMVLAALTICLPVFGIQKEDPNTNKRNYEQEVQAARKRRKQEKPQQLFPKLTTTVTTSTAIDPILVIYHWIPTEY